MGRAGVNPSLPRPMYTKLGRETNRTGMDFHKYLVREERTMGDVWEPLPLFAMHTPYPRV